MRRVVVAIGCTWVFTTVYSAQPPAPAAPAPRIDFVRDVQPIFKQHCYECHGPEKQSNGFRLDRRRSALIGGTEVVIGRGSAASSRLYLRLLGSDFGEKMPKDGSLAPADIATIKNWLDQGAEWPDEASGDLPEIPSDPVVLQLADALRNGNRTRFAATLATDPGAARRRGPNGSSALMWAALYGDAEAVRRTLVAGGDPNAANDAGVTALMWAVTDLAKTRLLVDAGADVNAQSADRRTPLLVACGIAGSREVARLLLDRGARITVTAPWTGGMMSPLTEAARIGDAALLRLLVERGVMRRDADPMALALAIRAGCAECVEMLADGAPRELLGTAVLFSAPPLAAGLATAPLLARGADPNVPHPFIPGLTPLIAAAASDSVPAGAVKALLDRGVDVHARTASGLTALDVALARGHTPVVDLLRAAGAHETAAPPEGAARPRLNAPDPRVAVSRSIPLLQRADVAFLRKAGCVSCHNNSLAQVTVALARQRSLTVDEKIARSQTQKIATYLEDWRERALVGHGIPGEADTVGYILMGLAAERHAPDAATDAMVRFLRLQQHRNGSWQVFAHRPPIESSDIQVTVAGLRSLQVYARGIESRLAAPSLARGTAWLRRARPGNTEDRAFQLLGFSWMGVTRPSIRSAARALLAEQRRDGGWGSLSTMESDAYATGQALVALAESGVVTAADPAYTRGVQFLLKTQHADGSWHVRTRAFPLQPPLDADFPHGKDQFISAAASHWATQALIYAVTKPAS